MGHYHSPFLDVVALFMGYSNIFFKDQTLQSNESAISLTGHLNYMSWFKLIESTMIL